MMRPDTVLGSLVDRWAVGSQQASRRNAMVALTALTQRRTERAEVEEFLAARTDLPEPSRSEVTGSVAGARG